MAENQQIPTMERVKNFVWFTAIALLVALAVVLWIRKATKTPGPGPAAAETPQQRQARLDRELRAAGQLALDHTDDQRRREGLRRLRELVAGSPDYLPARYALVDIALGLRENTLAEKTASDLVTERPSDWQAHAAMAAVLVVEGRDADAAGELLKAIDLNRQAGGEPQAELHGKLAGVYLKQGKAAEAEQELSVVLDLAKKAGSQGSWGVHAMFAEAALKQGKMQQADEHLLAAARLNLPATAIQLARSSLDLSSRLGQLLVDSRQREEVEVAYRLLTGAAQFKKSDADAQFLAAKAAARANHADEASRFLAAASQLKPDDPRIAELKGLIAQIPTTTRATTASAPTP